MPICRKTIEISIFGDGIEGLAVWRLETDFKRYSCINCLTSSSWWVSIRRRNLLEIESALLLPHSNSKVCSKDEHTSCAIFYVSFFGAKINGMSNIFSPPSVVPSSCTEGAHKKEQQTTKPRRKRKIFTTSRLKGGFGNKYESCT